MPTRHASTTWTGSLQEGTGRVDLTSSGIGSYEVSFPKRAADEADGATSPEELIAAAHSACFAMQFSALLAQAGGSNTEVNVDAAVSLGPDPAGGFHIPRIVLSVSGGSQGIDAAQFAEIAEQAKVGCPVSKALSGTEIVLNVK